jgi:hypothetical protein
VCRVLGSLWPYCTVPQRCQDRTDVSPVRSELQQHQKRGLIGMLCQALHLTLLRRRRVERSPLLFDFRAPALWAFHLTLFMFRDGQDDREFLTARWT